MSTITNQEKKEKILKFLYDEYFIHAEEPYNKTQINKEQFIELLETIKK